MKLAVAVAVATAGSKCSTASSKCSTASSKCSTASSNSSTASSKFSMLAVGFKAVLLVHFTCDLNCPGSFRLLPGRFGYVFSVQGFLSPGLFFMI